MGAVYLVTRARLAVLGKKNICGGNAVFWRFLADDRNRMGLCLNSADYLRSGMVRVALAYLEMRRPLRSIKSMIDVTGVDLKKFVQEVYALSVPVGLGFARPGGLSDAEAQEIIDRENDNGHIAASMDYVNGRQCKMTVFRKDGRLEIPQRWFDHSPEQLDELLKRCGIDR